MSMYPIFFIVGLESTRLHLHGSVGLHIFSTLWARDNLNITLEKGDVPFIMLDIVAVFISWIHLY